MTDLRTHPEAEPGPGTTPPRRRRSGRRRTAHRLAMRPRRWLVKLHRWSSIAMLAWFVVISVSGAWLVNHDAVESWFNGDRHHHTPGDVGPQAALDAGVTAMPDGASTDGLSLPRNGRGVYQVWGEVARPSPEGGAVPEPAYFTAFVDPGTGKVNEVRDEAAGATQWLYRGHMYLWQDHGPFNAFDPTDGWCRPVDGHEPGGVKGIACDVIPDGEDMVAWFGVGFLFILLSGFYLWYWPGVRRWADALRVRRGRGRFAFHLSLHKSVGLVVWVPLMVVAFTGVAFAFPNLSSWYENATPAQRDFALWEPAADPVSSKPDGRDPMTADEALAVLRDRYPERAVNSILTPADDTGVFATWFSRGFDPWTREGGGGNTYTAIDQYSGRTVYDGTPEDGGVFDQAWDDWSFPLHTGDFGGTTTRVLWAFLGLSPLVLAATGVVMSLVRRSKRAQRRESAQPAKRAEAAP
jgi:uncharacterized iron-regulated membrane protein